MRVIEQYIDNLFQELPETKEIKRIKSDLYLNAQDRYDELIAQGKAESEVLGTIITEIGDLDVLLGELGYDKEENLKDYSLNTFEEATEYILFNRRESTKIALGVFLILLGAGLIPTLDTFDFGMIGVILQMVFIAIAVGIFTKSGMKKENFKGNLSDEDHIFYMSKSDYEEVTNQHMDFKEKESFRIPLGIMLSILAVIPIIILSFMENEHYIERFGILLLMVTIGVGVSQFIKFGMVNSAYEKVLNIGEYSEQERELQKKMEPIAGVYWISMTLIYLTWSFLTMDWHMTWIVWPIAGLLWAIIAILLEYFTWKENK